MRPRTWDEYIAAVDRGEYKPKQYKDTTAASSVGVPRPGIKVQED